MKKIFLLVSSCIIFGPICLKSQTNNSMVAGDTLEIEEVVVVAQRLHTQFSKCPEAVSFMNKRELGKLSPMSMPHAIGTMPGIWMQKTNHGGGSPFIRGLTGYQTLIMIDGIRLNNATFRSGPNQYLNTIDPLSASRIEVLRGTGSVQYGSDAIGGTVYILTKGPTFSSNGFSVSGNGYAKWISNNMEKTGRTELNLGGKNVAVLAGVTYKDFGDIVAGGDLGKLKGTGYNELSGDLKARMKINDNNTITLTAQHLVQKDVPLYHKLVTGDYTTYMFDPQQRDLLYMRWNTELNGKIFSTLNTTLSYQYSLEERKKQKTGELFFDKETDKVYNYGFIVENISNISDNLHFSSGIDVYYDFINSGTITTDLETNIKTRGRGLYPDESSMLNISFFSLGNFYLNRWKINAGARYNTFNLGIKDKEFGDLAIKPGALVGNAGFAFRFLRSTWFTFSLNRAYRAPNINDVSSFGIADFRYEVPNYDLEPEQSLNTEVGVKHNRKKMFFGLHLYHNKLTNLITNVTASYNGKDSIDGYRVYHRENANKAYIQGIEGEVRYRLNSRVELKGFMVYTYGQNTSGDEPMRRIPPFHGQTSIIYSPLKNASINVNWYYAAKQTRLSGGDINDNRISAGGTPAWNAGNVSLNYRWKQVGFNIGIINLFNTPYRLHGSGIDGMGRSFWMSVRAGF